MSTPDEKTSTQEVKNTQQPENAPELTFRLTRPDDSHSESMEDSSSTQPTRGNVQWITEPEKQTTPERSVPTESAISKLPSRDDRKAKKSIETDGNVRNLPTGDEETSTPAVPLQTVKDENGFVYYKCRFCGLTFNFMNTLKAHERVHDVETPYLCNKCGESFHYMCELEYHAKSHLQQKGYKCECGRTFYQYTDLLYHTHPGEEGHFVPPLPEPRPPDRRSFSRPPIDPSEFPTPEFAEKGFEPRHPMRVFSEVRSKPYICQYCCKSYSDSRQLAYHMASHRGERMFNPRASRYLMGRNENSYISPGVDFKPPYI